MSVFSPEDFSISPGWEGDTVRVSHFEVAEDLRGNHLGSAILETLKRVYHYEGATRLIVRMGGGEAAVAFLKANDFTITNHETASAASGVEGSGIVTGEYNYDTDN